MRGGKRPGAGRKGGPLRVRLDTYVLAATYRAIERLALQAKSLGDALDSLLAVHRTTDK